MHFKCNKISFLSTRKMNQMIIAQFYCFVFILLLAFGLSTSSNLIFGLPTRHVRIVNHLNNKILTYHCKSGDDDLGVRTLKPNGEWEFSFRPTFYAVTEFYCYFFYENFHSAFDVYKDDGKPNIKVVKSLHIKRNKIDDFMRGNLYGFFDLTEMVVSMTSISTWFFSFFFLNIK